MISVNNDLQFDRFKADLDEDIQRHDLIKSGMFEQSNLKGK